MWVRVENAEVSGRVEKLTTSVWQYDDLARVGVMREVMLAPPYLWVEVLKGGLRNLRTASSVLTELQEIIHAPTVYAEVEPQLPRNQAFLRYLGFKEIPAQLARIIYVRSI
jgi:hypothetical protein